ncbi:MAG: type II toxin-antitoxin system VapC family toxin [Terriglobales bacterium]
MKLLLDTHIWLWHELQPSALEPRAAILLANPRNELWLSPVSIWELLLLVEKGRISLDRGLPAWLDACFAATRYLQAEFTIAVALAAAHIRLEHRDPADRLLAATARHYQLTLVTADQRLHAGQGFALWS